MDIKPPYAVSLLDHGLEQKLDDSILLPLTLAYLASQHVRVIIPLPKPLLPWVDSLFDELVSSLPIAGKGVVYQAAGDVKALHELISGACLLLTDTAKWAAAGNSLRIPTVQLQRGTAELHNPSVLPIDPLREDLIRWVKLANVAAQFGSAWTSSVSENRR
ncbi:MAG TPA: hypothetical protein VG892_03795 [Terriglobales bacterium]|jgi:hypothetical protein|nr:hypothetical protein [Terriglobales bacterium]